MCGIAGILVAGEGRPDLRARAEAMATPLAHRGPDDSGVWADPAAGIALSHRRLSILDLSPEGHQPMASPSGRYTIVFNGEIYNYEEIRAEIGPDQRWRGHSDTEVMLAAFERFGLEGTLPRLNGMFAFALWDASRRELHLARDRMGEKPLYYGWAGTSFVFASELKAMRADRGFRASISRDALALYLRHGWVPGPYTIYENVFKLPAATWMTVSADKPGESRPRAYWSLANAVHAQRIPASRTDDALDEIDGLARDAVRMRMHADVPLGAFLSGGIDSSTVVALMQSQSSRPVQTFTIGFREAGFDEAVYARKVAEHLGTDHSELYLTAQDALNVVPLLPAMYDEPFADSSQIPTHLVARLARKKVIVSLSGDGGDELFGGYERYAVAQRIWNTLGRVPPLARAGLGALIRAAAPAGSERLWNRIAPFLPKAMRREPAHKVRRLAALLQAESAPALYRDLLSLWRHPAALVKGSTEPPTLLETHVSADSSLGFLETMMYLDSMVYLPDDILVKVDRASMAVSLESRVPLLDHRLVEKAWMLPPEVKVKDGLAKWPLRRILYKHLPRELVERPKMGFGVPIADWIRGPLRGWAQDLLSEQSLASRGFLTPNLVCERLDQHLAGTHDWSPQLWTVLMFQAWLPTAA